MELRNINVKVTREMMEDLINYQGFGVDIENKLTEELLRKDKIKLRK